MGEADVIRLVVYGLIFGVGLLQLPLLVDLAANLLPHWQIKRWSNRFVGALLALVCVGVAVAGYWVWVTSALPRWLHPSPLRSPHGAAHLAFGSWLWALTMVSYVGAALVPPGDAPALRSAAADEAASGAVGGNAEGAKGGGGGSSSSSAQVGGGGATVSNSAKAKRVTDGELLESMRRPFRCRRCDADRPAGAYHCHDCGGCGDMVDHHCPFVNTCVGRDNYRFFICFLAFGTLGMLYSAVITFPAFHACWVASFALGDAANGRQWAAALVGAGATQHGSVAEADADDAAAVVAAAATAAACSDRPELTLVFLGPLGLGVALGNLLACQVVLLLGDVRTVDSLRYLRKTWNLWPILVRARELRGVRRPGSALHTLVFGPSVRWWQFFVPGYWLVAGADGKHD